MENSTDKVNWIDLVKRYEPFIRYEVRKYGGGLPDYIFHDFRDDLTSAGYRGLVEAVRRKDSSCEEVFDAYAKRWIIGTILKELCYLDPMTERQSRLRRRMRSIERELVLKLGRSANDDELAEANELSLEEYRKVFNSVNITVNRESDRILEEYCDSRGVNPYEWTLRREQIRRMNVALRHLTTRQLYVLKERYSVGSKWSDIATKMNVNISRVHELSVEAIVMLRRTLELERSGGSFRKAVRSSRKRRILNGGIR